MINALAFLKRHRVDMLYSLPLGMLLLTCIIKAIGTGYADFAAYYWGSKFLLSGNYKDVYETYRFNQLIDLQGYNHIFVSFTPFPPITSVFFAPFTCLPIGISKISFNVISSVVFIFTLVRIIRYFTLPSYLLILIPVLFFAPIRNNIFFGQSYLLLFSMLAEGYLAFEKKQNMLCALLWSTAIVFKIFPFLILAFLLFKRQFRLVIMIARVSLVLVGLSVGINGIGAWKIYLTELLPRLNNGELNDSFSQAFQSGQMLFKRIFIPDKLLNPTQAFNSPLCYVISVAAFKSIIISFAIATGIQKRGSVYLSFVVWLTASILISPNGSTYSLVLLLFPFLAFFLEKKTSITRLIVSILVLLICNVPVHYFEQLPLVIQFPRLYLMLLLFSMLILLRGIRVSYALFSFLVIFFIGIQAQSLNLFSSSAIDTSSYLLSKEEYLLIYDYDVNAGKLVYNYWSDEGAKLAETGISLRLTEDKFLELKNNQLYYKGKQITNSPDRKLKPEMLSDNSIIYLSDKNRGIGFYTLRKLKLN